MQISELQIGRYGPLGDFSHQFEDNLEVFFGPNESGKTLLLESVLKLLSSDISGVFPGISRVSEQPSGHLYLETPDGEEQLGDDLYIEDISDITPNHLRNVFVVRDSDLELRDEHTFYDSVTQRIGDLHTNEIQAVQERLVETGRLTSLDGRGLSSAAYRDNAEDVRDSAADLAEDIQAYIEEVESDDIAGAEREFISVKTELQRCEKELSAQEDAETMDLYETLSGRLEDYRTAVDSIDEAFTRETLEDIRDLDRDAQSADEEIDELSEQRENLREEIRDLESDRETVEAELSPLEDRSDDVDDVEHALKRFREVKSDAIGAGRGMDVAKYVAIGGVGLGGIGAVFGSTLAGVILAIVGVFSLGWYWLQLRSIRAEERGREEVLALAQDAGLEVNSVEGVGPAIREFRDRVQALEERRDSLEKKVSINETRLDDLGDDLDSERATRQDNRDSIRETLSEANVDDIEAYRNAVNQQEGMVNQRNSAEQSLSDTLDEPDTESPERKIEYWEAELSSLIADVDGSVTSDTYDSDRLEDLRAEHERLVDRRENLREELDEHNNQVAMFIDRIQELSTQPFLDDPIALDARTVAGLRKLIPQLERLLTIIDQDADAAREALDIFDGLKAEEEQKITDLFGQDSRATVVFHRITEGRYEEVGYDTDEQVLTVRRDGGEVFTASQLSRGAKTQLYLSARVGLGEQLLGSEPGFFLMDDAFLPADGTRVREGFEILQELANDGWQILYFTAKDEVGEDVVEDSDLSSRNLTVLE
jgi:phage shock protein A